MDINSMLKPFSGESNENCEDWLSRLIKFATFRGLTEKQTVALFSLLLKDTAGLWFECLPTDLREKQVDLFAEFLQQFKPSKFTDGSFQREQRADESALHFIFDMYLKGIRNQRSDEEIRLTIMFGLLPKIRREIILQNPLDIKTLINSVKLLEDIDKMNDNNQYNSHVKEIEGQKATKASDEEDRRTGEERKAMLQKQEQEQ